MLTPFFPAVRAVAVALCALVAGVVPAAAQMFNPESFTLKNGMQVVVISNHRVPVLSHMVWYKVGSGDELPDKGGLAHMVEHMMFKGTRTVAPGQFSLIVAQNGGRDNAFTTADYTAFFQDVAADRLELVIKLEADRMANLALQDKDFQPERQVVLEERRMRIENEPQALLDEQMAAALFLNGGYHHPVIGWRTDIENYRLEDVVAFHQRWYAPNNAILVVSGDITAAQLKPLAEKYYGAIPARPVPLRQRAPEPPPIAARTIELRDQDVHQPDWSRAYLAPSQQSGETRFATPLQVLSEILGGGATSRFYKSLVVEQALAVSAATGYNPRRLGLSEFDIEASPRPGVTLADLQKAVLAQIQRVVTEGVSAEEVERAKSRLQAEVAYARDSFHTGARVLGAALASGETIASVESWPQRIAAVTTDQVNEAARAVLRDERSVTGLLLPAAPGEGTVAPRGEPPLGAAAMGREIR